MPSAFARAATRPVLLCLSHLRWDFVFQRPQHLMVRAQRDYDVHFFEEPVPSSDGKDRLCVRTEPSGVVVVTPHTAEGRWDHLRKLLDGYLTNLAGRPLTTWYYTPMALKFSGHLKPDCCVYDCMDELSAFRFAPTDLPALEAELFRRADVVFTGGRSLYEAKRRNHANIHCFPSSVDTAHFGKARRALTDPDDQSSIGHPRIGFFGVIDERMDLDLVAQTARFAPDLQFVMIGPITKIDPGTLPNLPNIHWLGRKSYDELPAYMSNWDAAWMPFALNESTRFISPTKTPEFLSAGLPVCSTPVPDVVSGYGERGLVAVAEGEAMVDALRAALRPRPSAVRAAVDRQLARSSWDSTWERMARLIAAQPQAAVALRPSKGARTLPVLATQQRGSV